MVFLGCTAILSLERFRRAPRQKQAASPKLSSRSSWEKTASWPKTLRGLKLCGRARSSSQKAKRSSDQRVPEYVVHTHNSPRSEHWYEEGDGGNKADVYIDSQVAIPLDLYEQMMKVAEESIDRGQHRSVRRVSLEQISGSFGTKAVRISTESLVLNEVFIDAPPAPKLTVDAQIPVQNMDSYAPSSGRPTSMHGVFVSDGLSSLDTTAELSWTTGVDLDEMALACNCGLGGHPPPCAACGYPGDECACVGVVQFAELCHRTRQVPVLKVRQGQMFELKS